MERFVIIITKRSILDVAAALDTPLGPTYPLWNSTFYITSFYY